MQQFPKAILASAVILAASVLFNVVVARVLGPEGRGAVAELILVMTLGSVVAFLSLDQAMIINSKRWVTGYLPRFSDFLRLLPLVMAIYVFVVALLILAIDAKINIAMFAMIIVYIVSHALGSMVTSAVLISQNGNIWNVLRVLPHIFYLIISMLVISFDASVEHIVYAFIFGNVFAALAGSIIYMLKFVPTSQVAPAAHRLRIGETIRLGAHTHVHGVTRIIGERVDIVALAIFFSAQSLGLYVSAAGLGKALLFLAASVEPLFIRLLGSSSKRDSIVLAFALQLSLPTVLISIAIAAWLSKFVVVLLFGPSFAESWLVLACFLVGAPLAFLRMIFAALFKSRSMFGHLRKYEFLFLTTYVLGVAVSTVFGDWQLIAVSYPVAVCVSATAMIAESLREGRLRLGDLWSVKTPLLAFRSTR